MKNQPTSTCSAESEDSLLPLDGLDLKQLDSATTNPTHKQSSKSIGRMSQSTETSKHSMARHIEGSLFSQEDFPASRSVVPGSEEARQMTAISGRKCLELYKKQNPLGLLVKMLLVSSIWNSKKRLLTWKIMVTKSNRLLFQLAPLMPYIAGTGFRLLPTPTASDKTYGRRPTTKRKDGPKTSLRDVLSEKYSMNGMGGSPHPSFVEAMMGYPTGHTALKDWATPSSRRSPTKSSKA